MIVESNHVVVVVTVAFLSCSLDPIGELQRIWSLFLCWTVIINNAIAIAMD